MSLGRVLIFGFAGGLAAVACGSDASPKESPASDASDASTDVANVIGDARADLDASANAADWWLQIAGTTGAAVSTMPGAIVDGSGHHLDATAGAGLIFDVGEGLDAASIAFPASGTGISVNDPRVGDVADFSATDSFTFEVGFRTSVHGRDDVSGSAVLFERPRAFSLVIVNGHLQFTLATGAPLVMTTNVSDGRWHRATVSRDVASGEVVLSLDAETSVKQADPSVGQKITGDDALWIGAHADGSGSLLGEIDHVAIHHAALAPFTNVGAVGPSTIFRAATELVPEGGTYAYVRIPSMVRASDGTLIVAAEGRVDSADDLGNIDVVVKRSLDNGKTWSSIIRAADAGSNKVGNPILFYDADHDRIVLMSLVTGVSGGVAVAGTSKVQVQHSEDHGATWSAPVDITASVSDSAWQEGVLIGPSHGIQLKNGPNAGALVVHGMHRRATDGARGGHLLVSRDGGATWSIAAKENGSTPLVNVNEGSVAELTDGRLYVNTRNQVTDVDAGRVTGLRGEAFVKSDITYASDPAFAPTTFFRGPVVHGATLRWVGSERFGDEPRILFSFPAGEYGTNFSSRMDLRLYVSHDDAKHFSPGSRIYGGKAAYSDLVAIDDGRLGIIYETALDSEDFDTRVEFHAFSLQDLDDPTVLAWTFEDASVGAAITSSRSSGTSTATLSGDGAVTAVAGRQHSTAAHFASSRLCGNAAAINHAADLGIRDGFEIRATFRTAAHASGGANASGAIVAKTIVGTASAFWMRVEDGKVKFAVGDDTGALDTVVSNETVSDGAFHTVRAARDFAGKRLTISIDGKAPATTVITTTSFVTNTESLCIGAFADAGLPRAFTGDIDDVAILLTQ